MFIFIESIFSVGNVSEFQKCSFLIYFRITNKFFKIFFFFFGFSKSSFASRYFKKKYIKKLKIFTTQRTSYIYIYIYIYKNVNIYIYIYIYIFTFLSINIRMSQKFCNIFAIFWYHLANWQLRICLLRSRKRRIFLDCEISSSPDTSRMQIA